MSRTWTSEQQAAIDLHGCNLLVAAAAGSGKTAVLVERVVKMVTRDEDPVDLDRILIVTFTRAAASEMRERIQRAIEEKLVEAGKAGEARKECEGHREREERTGRLKRQAALLPHSFIMTIDSFCAYVVRNYCHSLDMDPDFRIGDAGELALLKADVMQALLEEKYEEADEDFLHFVECYGGARGDQELEKYIGRMYEFSRSDPWPEEWLERCVNELTLPPEQEIDSLSWVDCLLREVKRLAGEAQALLSKGLALSREPDGPYMYEEMFLSDLAVVEELLEAEGAGEIFRILDRMKFVRRSAKKDADVSEEKKTLAAGLRDQGKKALQDIKKQYFIQSPEEIRESLALLKKPVETLVNLVREYGLRFARAKAEKNILDFNDLEHCALDILVAREEGRTARTEAAKELSAYFQEIMIDEYQDSSLLQEYILNSISGEEEGRPNQFMVGDVKQSIYSFRKARPELFIGKYREYRQAELSGGEQPGRNLKIDLHANFRSRPQVLKSANQLFYQIMGADLGEVVYDEAAALYPAAVFPEEESAEGPEYAERPEGAEGLEYAERSEDVDGPEYVDSPADYETELILVDGQQAVYSDIQDEEYHIRELEAKVVAARIRELTDPVRGMGILDAGTGGYRPVCYRDIVILLRSMTGWAQVMTAQLEDAGIPAYTESSTGYFSAPEVQTVLNLLKIIDNPRQDIPLAGVLMSPVGGFSQEEMAALAGEYKKKKKENSGLYEKLKAYGGQEPADCGEQEKEPCGEPENTLRAKVSGFLRKLNRYREASFYMSVHQILQYVLEDSGYGDFAAAMPGGEARRANLNMLVSYAINFEKTSYHGLFQFVRYIEHLQKYEVDFGAASVFSEQDDIVKITTIHKSKGLEYPVVILAGAGKRFNFQDSRERILLHPLYGAAADLIDLKLRLKIPALMKKVIQRQLTLEQQGEELRILYVAMTRAKEKLIVTAGDNHMESKLKKWEGLKGWERRLLPVSVLSQGISYLDWFLMGEKRGADTGIRTVCEDVAQVIGHEILRLSKEQMEKKTLLRMMEQEPEAEERETQDALRRQLTFCYPGKNETEIYSKLSVSELKERQEEDGAALYSTAEQSVWEEYSEQNYSAIGPSEGEIERQSEEQPEEQTQPSYMPPEEALPGFMRERRARTGTALGTLYHRVAEHMDFAGTKSVKEVRDCLSALVDRGLLSTEERKRISEKKWSRLLSSDLGRRLAKAQKAGCLYRERQFIMGLPARLLRPEWDSDELVVVQGIVDAWFVEDGKIVIVDYKTDRVAEEKNLIDRYGKQLYYYRMALEQSEQMPVKECVIYSFGLDKEIRVEMST